jgi:hypothetical protein
MTAMMGGGGGYSSSMIPGGSIAGASPNVSSMSSFGSGTGWGSPGMGNTMAGGVMDIFSGIQANSAYGTEAGALKAQANEAIRQAELDAAAKANEVRQFAGNQQEEYASSGVTLAGTPAEVIADTQKRGQQEVDAIARRGAFQAQMMRTQANQAQSSGRNAILGGIFKAGTSIASAFI